MKIQRDNCGNPINLGPNASCNLQLDITGAVSSNFAICKGNSCTTATTPLGVSGPSVPRFAYVTQYDSNNGIVVCVVDHINGLLSNCGDVGAHDVLDGIFPQAIAINSAGTIAYITTYNDLPYAYQCTIDRNNGTFSTCTAINITTPSNYDHSTP